MEVDENNCKYCNVTLGDKLELIEKEKSFDELVNELKNNRPQYVMYDKTNKLGKSDIMKWLLQNATKESIEPLYIDKIVDECLYSNEIDIIKILKSHGVLIEIPKSILESDVIHFGNIYEDYAIYYAVQLGSPEIINWILDFQVNSNITKTELNHLLNVAAKEGNLNTIIELIELGANIHYANYEHEEETVLEISAERGYYHVIEWLLDNIINENDHSCVYALQIAIENKQYDIIKLLVESTRFNINTRRIESTCETIIHIASEIGNISLIEYLEGYDCILESKDKYNKSIVHFAAEHGQLNLLKWVHSRGMSLTECAEANYSPFHYAASSGEIECIKYLVHKNCDINMKILGGYSVLHFAVTSRNIEVIKFLIAHGADPLITDDEGNTLFHSLFDIYSSERISTIDIVTLLASYNVDFKAKNAKGQTLLECAVKVRDHKVVKWLLDQGININDLLKLSTLWLNSCEFDNDWNMLLLCIKHMNNINQIIDGETLLYKAACFPQAVKILIENNADVNIVDLKTGNSPLIKSLTNKGESDAAEILLKHYANIHIVSKYGYTALYNAVANCNNVQIVKKLLDLGADVNKGNIIDETSPLIASLGDKLDIKVSQILLDHDADVNIVSIMGNTALYQAIITNRNIEFIKKLIELGADVNAGDELEDYIILHAAVMRGDLDIVKCIVQAGANVNSTDNSEFAAINLSSNHVNEWKIVRYLVENGADVNYYTIRPVLFDAIKTGDVELVAFLCSRGASTDIIVPYQLSFVHNCQYIEDENKKLRMLQLLISHGANINCSNHIGETILFSVIHNIHIVDLLLKAGINVNKENANGVTALHQAILEQNYANNQIQIVLKLIDYGANINHPDGRGNTPLHLAVANLHCSDIARFLVQKGAYLKAVNTKGSSILHDTCCGELGMWLISQGADVNAKNNVGVTVLQYALQNFPRENVKNDAKIINSLVKRSITNVPISVATVDSINTSRYIQYLHTLIDNVNNINTTNNQGLTALHDVVYTDNVTLLDHMFKKGANILSKSNNGNTVLHFASSDGSINIVTYILDEMKHDLLFKGNNSNETPLHLAVKSNHVDIVKLLLQHTFDIDQKCNSDMTALQLACKNNNLEIVKLLVSKGANLYEIYDNTNTPIHIVLKNYNLEIFKYLVELKNHNLIAIKNGLDQTLLHIAAKDGDSKLKTTPFVEYIVEKKLIPVNCVDKFGNTPLHYACNTYAVSNVESLVNNGALINVKNKTGNTPLHFAARVGRRDIVSILMEKGGKAKLKNNKGNTSIHMAAAHKCNQISDLLIDKTEDLYIKNRKGNSPIHQAAVSTTKVIFTGLINDHPLINLNIVNQMKQTPLQLALKLKNEQHPNVINCIRKNGINNQDIRGNTALHIATYTKNCEEIRSELLKNGADVSIENKNGDSPMYFAMKLYKNKSIKNLLPYVTDVYYTQKFGLQVIRFAIKNCDLNILQLLFKMADVQVKTKIGQTYLHIALQLSCIDKFKWLIPHCKSIINEKENRNGYTVLHQCIIHGLDIQILELLLENGADINAVDNNKNSALHMAVEHKQNEHIIHLLISHNIDINLTNFKMETALHVAVRSQNTIAIAKLCTKGVNINAVNIKGQTALHLAVINKNLAVVVFLVKNKKCDFNIKDYKCRNALTLSMLIDDNADVANWLALNC